MNKSPLISIVLACYNGMAYIRQQLSSLEVQDYPNFEVIIVDDASSDGTYELLLEYTNQKANWFIFRNIENKGLVATFEKGICLANGEFIALCDQDDVWFSNKLSTLMLNLGDNWLIHSDANLIDGAGVIFETSYFAYCKHEINSYAQYLIENNVTGCTCLFRKKLLSLINNRFPHGVTVHDRILAILAAKVNKIKYLNQVLISYRQHSTNQVGALSKGNNNLVLNRHLQDLNVLSREPYFIDDVDIKYARNYYNVLLKNERVSFKLLSWIIRKLGVIWYFKFIVKALLK